MAVYSGSLAERLEQQRQRSHAPVALPALLELGVERTLPHLTDPRHPRRSKEEHQQKPREPARLKFEISSRIHNSAKNESFQEKRRFFHLYPATVWATMAGTPTKTALESTDLRRTARAAMAPPAASASAARIQMPPC
jgi:hypothetical protein